MSGQVRSSQLRQSKVKSVQMNQVRSGQVMSAHFKFSSGHIRVGRGMTCQAKSGYGQEKSGQVRLSQVR